jgi:hypothetical protein
MTLQFTPDGIIHHLEEFGLRPGTGRYSQRHRLKLLHIENKLLCVFENNDRPFSKAKSNSLSQTL